MRARPDTVKICGVCRPGAHEERRFDLRAFHFDAAHLKLGQKRKDRQAMLQHHCSESLKRCNEGSIHPLSIAVTNLQLGDEMQRPLEYPVARKRIQSQLTAIFRHFETEYAERRAPLPA
jgi:hypothetical protein